MEIPPVTIKFNSHDAESALQLLAEAALESPDIVKGIAKLEGELFDSAPRDYFDNGDRVIEVALFPTERLKQFLRGLGKLPRPR